MTLRGLWFGLRRGFLMGLLEDRREREYARRQARVWAASAAGQHGLPQQMFPTRQSGGSQPQLGAPLPEPSKAGEVCAV